LSNCRLVFTVTGAQMQTANLSWMDSTYYYPYWLWYGIGPGRSSTEIIRADEPCPIGRQVTVGKGNLKVCTRAHIEWVSFILAFKTRHNDYEVFWM